MIAIKNITSYFLISFFFFHSKIIYLFFFNLIFPFYILYKKLTSKYPLIIIIFYVCKILNEFCKQNDIYFYMSIFIYLIFLFKIYNHISLLVFNIKDCNEMVSLNPKINYTLLKIHYKLFYKESKLKKLMIIVFILFKLKILYKIIILRYIEDISCFGVLYSQYLLYIKLIDIFYYLNRSLMRTRSIEEIQDILYFEIKYYYKDF